MKNVALYIRVSTEEQVKYGFSIEAQKTALIKYATNHNYKYELFVDEGISASSMKRPALQKMLSKVGSFDMLLFTKLDRLSRNVLDANNINKILKQNNVTMKAIDEDDVDTSTADGTFIFNLKVSLAQREIGKTSERIKFVFESKRAKGEITSGAVKYGYKIKDKKYIVNPKEAENVVKIYEFYIDVNGNFSKTYQFFAELVKGKGVTALRSILRDTAYIGKYKLYKKDEYLDNYIPRIMDDELFYKVQSLHRKQGRIRGTREALFSGLLRCDTCKSKMTKKADYRVKDTIYYVCNKYGQYTLGTTERKCAERTYVREDVIENYLLDNLQNLAKDYIANVKTTKRIEKDTTKDVTKLKNKLKRLKDLYLNELIDLDTYKTDYAKLKKELAEYEKKPENVDVSKLNQLLNTDIKSLYSKLSFENKRKFWLSIIDNIYISKREVIKVDFNCALK